MTTQYYDNGSIVTPSIMTFSITPLKFMTLAQWLNCDTQHNNIQHNYNQYYNSSHNGNIVTLSITTFSITTLINMTLAEL